MNAVVNETAVHIELGLLDDSPHQPARVSTRGNIDELAASMRDVGVLEPLLVRPGLPGRYELVAGHRRKRAAGRAGLVSAPCFVREYSDEQVLEIQAVENGQREGLHPLDEAHIFLELKNKVGRSAAEIADKIGRDVSYVQKRLQLEHLCKEAREALDEDRIALGAALLLARIPDAKQQRDALEAIRGNDQRGALPLKRAAQEIRARFMLRVADAPFDVSSPELVPKAGPCTTCPKRTGNQPELFDDVDSPDLCTDGACYRSKLDAHWKRVSAEAKKGGTPVLSAKDTEEVFGRYGGDHVRGSKWNALSGNVYDHKTLREVKVAALLKGSDVKATLARNPYTGSIVELVPAAVVTKALAARNKVDAKAAKAKAKKLSPAAKAKLEREQLEKQAREETLKRCLAQIGDETAKRQAGAVEGLLLDLMFDDLLHAAAEGLDLALERRGVALKGTYLDRSKAAEKWRKAAPQSAQRALVLEALVGSSGLSWRSAREDRALERACKALGVDQKAIQKQVIAEIKAPKPAADSAKGAKTKTTPTAKARRHG